MADLVARLHAAPWASLVRVEHGVVTVVVDDPAAAGREILSVVVSAGVALAAFERARPSLEDVFLRLVGHDEASHAAPTATIETPNRGAVA